MSELREAERTLQAALAAVARCRAGLVAGGAIDLEPVRAALRQLARQSTPPPLRPLLLALLDELLPLQALLDEELRASASRLGQLDAHRQAGMAYRRGSRS
ncbi:hypothetical protein SH611_10930 [Geminicoccaceae bacterium 1502E]|nr:hypothetical protein [Geminicoccaceae bacterium 1502E]